MKKKNSKAGGVFAIILLGGLIVAYLVTAILSLIGLAGAKSLSSNFEQGPKDGEYIEGYFHIGTDLLLTMKHTINLIPSGNEYYYAVFNDNLSQMLIVRGDKHFADNFPTTDPSSGSFFRINENGASIKGKIRKLDYKEKKEFSTFISDAKNDGVETVMYGSDILFLDATTGHIALLKLIFVGMLILAGALGAYSVKNSNARKNSSGVSPLMTEGNTAGQPTAGTGFVSFDSSMQFMNEQADKQAEELGLNQSQPVSTATVNGAPVKKTMGPPEVAGIVSIILFFGSLIGMLYTMTFM